MCDLAETYGIYDYKSLPPSTVAIFAVGLREDSRIKTKLRGGRAGDDTNVLIGLLYDRITDILAFLGAFKTRPESLTNRLLGIETNAEEKHKARAYSSAEEFEKARGEIVETWQQN